jgi:hypothetical protein
MMSGILGVGGRPMYMVGGRGARESGVRGDIAWSMQYINDEPALCMWRRSNTLGEQMRLGSGKRVFAICLSSLWKYIDHRGNLDVKTATLEAMREVVQMGFGDPGKARGAVHNIIGVMDDKLEDLLRMKPRPDGYTDTLAPEIRMGEFIVKDQNTGKVLHEGEIRG